jgi:hypothetical protein
MKARPDPPPPDYAESLAAYEAQRRAADDVLLRGMVQVRQPMNPGLASQDVSVQPLKGPPEPGG